MKPLPHNQKQKSFFWQSKTDKEIEVLEKEYKALSFLKKILPSGWAKRKEIRKAKQCEFEFVDIWEQSTYANKQFQDFAKNAAIEVENQQIWVNVPQLVSMLFIEKGVIQKVLDAAKQSINSIEYVEKYAAEYKARFLYCYELFFKQKKVLTVGQVIKLQTFFLPKWKKPRPLIRTFFE